jgi:hypothetical protein
MNEERTKRIFPWAYWLNPLFYLLIIYLIFRSLIEHLYDWIVESYMFLKYLIRKEDWMP